MSLTNFELSLIVIMLLAVGNIIFQLLPSFKYWYATFKSLQEWNNLSTIMRVLAQLNLTDYQIYQAIESDYSDEIIELLVLSAWFVKHEQRLKSLWIEDPDSANDFINSMAISRYNYFCECCEPS